MIERHHIRSREQWLALRRRDVTASDVGVVCGAHKFKTPLRLYEEKVGSIPEDVETPVMIRGRWMEPAVLKAVQERHPDWLITQPGVYLRDPDIRIGATPDAVAIIPDEGE
jgi:predicted phage-related endonuclease